MVETSRDGEGAFGSVPGDQSGRAPGAGGLAGRGDVGASTRTADESNAPPGIVVRTVLVLLRGYKILISPLFAGACRYTPSCSDYMAEAVRRHGVLRGGWLGVVRLSRCRPFGGHGFDPVPAGRHDR